MVEFGLGGMAWPTGFPKAYIMPAVENGLHAIAWKMLPLIYRTRS